jgi:vacuolar-type H+-ATPase subunit C/Vma6
MAAITWGTRYDPKFRNAEEVEDPEKAAQAAEAAIQAKALKSKTNTRKYLVIGIVIIGAFLLWKNKDQLKKMIK